MKRISFAIVGGGPAGFYIGKCLSRLGQKPVIDLYEKEFCPFGLIRYGVAPDHVSIKKSENVLSSLHDYPYFRYIGNSPINAQQLARLRHDYSGVILATGAQEDNEPEWAQKALKKGAILNARQVVYWYNNYPAFQHFQLPLSDKQTVVLVGNGNVAIDIARILLRRVQDLRDTEISRNALSSLRDSQVRNVCLVARKGFAQSAFALKELRELTTCGVKVFCVEEEMEASFNEASYQESTEIGSHNAATVRMNKRKIDFVRSKCHIVPKKQLPDVLESREKKVILRFLLDPLQVGENKLACCVTRLEGAAFKQEAVRTQQKEDIPFDLLINSTGFRVGGQIQAHFQIDDKTNCIPNSNGCVLSSPDKLERGLYVVGWCKSGPRGVIDQTLLGCEETYNNIRIQIEGGGIEAKEEPRVESEVNFERYLKLKEVELARGDPLAFKKGKLSHEEVVSFFRKK